MKQRIDVLLGNFLGILRDVVCFYVRMLSENEKTDTYFFVRISFVRVIEAQSSKIKNILLRIMLRLNFRPPKKNLNRKTREFAELFEIYLLTRGSTLKETSYTFRRNPENPKETPRIQAESHRNPRIPMILTPQNPQ